MPTGLKGTCTIVHGGKRFEGSYSEVRGTMRVTCKFGSKISPMGKSTAVMQAKKMLIELVANHV